MNTRKLLMLKNTEFIAAQLILQGQSQVDTAIHFLGTVIDRTTCKETIQACERLIEVLNDGPQTRKINELSEEQANFAANILSAVYDCVTLQV